MNLKIKSFFDPVVPLDGFEALEFLDALAGLTLEEVDLVLVIVEVEMERASRAKSTTKKEGFAVLRAQRLWVE